MNKLFIEKAESFASVIDALLVDEKTLEEYRKDPILELKKHGIEFKDQNMAKNIEKLLLETHEIKGRGSVSHPVYVITVCVVVTANNTEDQFVREVNIDHDRVDTFLELAELRTRTNRLEEQIGTIRDIDRLRPPGLGDRHSVLGRIKR